MAIHTRPAKNRMFLISGTMPTVSSPDQFGLYGQQIAVKDGRLINAEGNLAGAHLIMAQAGRMTTSVPATCIGVPA